MALKDLQVRQGKVDVVVDVIEKGDVRTFNKFGNSGRVANAKVKDESGEMTLTLWNDDIDKVNVGDKIQIKNGYVGEWQGEPQLSTGKFGSMEVVGKASASAPGASAKEATPATDDNFEDESGDVQEESIDDLYDEEEN
ncbi:MAG: replication factor A1 [archaeon GW2011_AR3]|nr:MAG: replication factor A1 [archaeon GW2011_AR3]MBS3110182.1 hypothetical protein [Candidatus Woesearchaeota archaeon]